MFDGRGGLATSPDPDGAAAAAPDSTDGVLRRKGRLDSLEELMLQWGGGTEVPSLATLMGSGVMMAVQVM